MQSRKERAGGVKAKTWQAFWARLAGGLILIGFPLVAIGVGLLLLPTAWVGWPLPALPADTMIYSQDGHLISVLFARQNRMPIAYRDIPPMMSNALVAIEDDTFWIEPAIDPVGMFRAAAVDIAHRRILQGGSTITQQLAKNLYLTPRRTFIRKMLELLITLKLATTYSRRQILNMYLNDVYFGQGAWGVQAASLVYFGHGARSLTLPESALLAGSVSAPSYFDPYRHPHAALLRRNLVLQRMRTLGYITPTAARQAMQSGLHLSGPYRLADQAPYFTQLVARELALRAPAVARRLAGGGYRVLTTLNWTDQRAANAAVAYYLPPTALVRGVPQPEAALVALDPRNGYVRALVGGDNYARTQFNRALFSRRQPGSTMKYFLYTTVIDDGYPTSSTQLSAPVRFVGAHGAAYVPHNYGLVYHGRLTIRRAIALSDNIVAVKWMHVVGPPTMIRTAQAMGIISPLADNLATALGASGVTPMEMARAVAPLANGGQRVRPISVLRVTDANGRPVFVQHPHRTPVLQPQVAYVVSQLFRAPLDESAGTAHNLQSIINRPAAAKTGTSNSQRDAWLVGYTPQLTTAVWVGNDNDAPLGLTGDRGAGPIWAHFLRWALAGRPRRTFASPPGVVWKSVCRTDGLLPNGCCSTYREVYVAGHVPTAVSPGCSGGSWGRLPETRPSAPIPPPSGDWKSFVHRLIKSLFP